MCGLFGYLSKTGCGPDLDRLRRIALETQLRGAHAFGLAWVAPDGKLHVFKRPGSAAANLDALDRCRDALIVAGHCRYATHGDPADNRNNHPHRAGRGWLVHNGIVRNHASIARRYGRVPETECDSEVLGLLMAKVPGSLQRRAAIGVAAADGPLALLGVWSWPARLLLVRRGNPLWVGETRTGAYLGSLPGELPEGARSVPEGCAMVHTLGDRLQVSQVGSRNAGLPRVAAGGSRRLRMAANPSQPRTRRFTMKKDEIKVGGTYLAKVSERVVPVRIDAENRHGGWDATNLLTDKKVRIKSAQLLRCPANRDGSPQTEPEVQPVTDGSKKASKTKGKKSARAKPEANGEAKAKKLGCLDAAVRVLGESDQPMTCREMIEAMAAKGYWSSPGGATPDRTLYSAIAREITTKAKESRFVKSERGKFALAK